MASRRVLIISAENDIHAVAVKRVLSDRFGASGHVLDLSLYPLRASMSATISKEGQEFSFSSLTVQLENFPSAWWRRPQPLTIDGDIWEPRLKQFVVEETWATFEGIVEAAACRFVNDRSAEARANRKVLQLSVASTCGFRVPQTLVTSNVEQAKAFIDKLAGNVVYKPQGDARYHMAEARLIDEAALNNLELVETCPVIFQEYVPPTYDIRLNVVGDHVFATRIDLHPGTENLDWRLDPLIPMRDMACPSDVHARSLSMCRRLGLDFGAFDLRVTSSGDIVFFEVNPSGQFLFCELDGTLKITEAMCALLLDPPPLPWEKRGSAARQKEKGSIQEVQGLTIGCS